MSLSERGFSLVDWQEKAVETWLSRDDHRGTLEIFTGGGKTLIALACAARLSRREPGLVLTIVVPTVALAAQWRESVLKHTDVSSDQIRTIGAGSRDTVIGARVIIAVLNTAAKRLPILAKDLQPLMLVVDECHRAGSAEFSRLFGTTTFARLGLSATPDREEIDEEGEPIAYDEQLLGRELGPVIYSFSLKDARERGWLPRYTIEHHGVELKPDELIKYEQLSMRIDQVEKQMREVGLDPSAARRLQSHAGDLGDLARKYIAAVSKRKDLLYSATERMRVAVLLIRRNLEKKPSSRVLIFNERVTAAEELADALYTSLPAKGVGVEHSRLKRGERNNVLQQFRSGEIQVLVSVRSLVEGIDVPEADIGLSVASSSSVRQRIQALGRVLRRSFDQPDLKQALMIVIYVSKTVDTLIYRREDWSDLTGPAENFYYVWSVDASEPTSEVGPPDKPAPTEEQEFERIGHLPPGCEPITWLGVVRGAEYSVDSGGLVKAESGAVIENAQGVAEMMLRVRSAPGGRFKVSPRRRYVLIWDPVREETMAAGVLSESFRYEDSTGDRAVAEADLIPGSPYLGPRNSTAGEYRIKANGQVERKTRGGRDLAELNEPADDIRVLNGRRLVDAWRSLRLASTKVSVNDLGHAWYRQDGNPRFLAKIEGGLLWPDSLDER